MSTNRHLLGVERKMHFEIARTTAAISLIFIISITPWAFQEGVIACIGGQVISETYYIMRKTFSMA